MMRLINERTLDLHEYKNSSNDIFQHVGQRLELKYVKRIMKSLKDKCQLDMKFFNSLYDICQNYWPNLITRKFSWNSFPKKAKKKKKICVVLSMFRPQKWHPISSFRSKLSKQGQKTSPHPVLTHPQATKKNLFERSRWQARERERERERERVLSLFPFAFSMHERAFSQLSVEQISGQGTRIREIQREELREGVERQILSLSHDSEMIEGSGKNCLNARKRAENKFPFVEKQWKVLAHFLLSLNRVKRQFSCCLGIICNSDAYTRLKKILREAKMITAPDIYFSSFHGTNQ